VTSRPDKVIPALSPPVNVVEEDTPGVDLTLIDEMLRLSPEQRLRQNDRMAALAVALQEAFAAGANGWPKHER
jgi:hypothetical protein